MAPTDEQCAAAAKVMDMLARLSFVFFALILLMFVAWAVKGEKEVIDVLIPVAFMSLSALLYWLSKALVQGKKWAQYGTVTYAVLLLGGFPIGTAIGGYLLYVLLSKPKTI